MCSYIVLPTFIKNIDNFFKFHKINLIYSRKKKKKNLGIKIYNSFSFEICN